ncbi:E3 ubiquitin-protein ligase CBLL2 [Chlorella vulgaris]
MSHEAQRFKGQIEPRHRGRKTHICASCDFPIAVYGRCAPCLHAYCLTCATSMTQCIICHARITKLERIPKDAGVFISPLTLQSFRTQADLASHAQKLGAQLMQLMGGGTGGMPSMQQLAVMQAGQQQGWKPPPPPLPAGGFGRPPQQHMPRYQHGVAARPQHVHPQAQQAPWPRQAGVPS